SFSWNRGFLSGAGTTRLSSDITFTNGWGVSAGRLLDTNGHNLTWDGDAFSSASVFGLTGGGTIENRAASTIPFFGHPTSTTSRGTGNSAATLINEGTFDLHNAGALQIDKPLSNSGTILINSGTYEDAAHVIQTAAGSLDLSGGVTSS